MDKLKIVDSLEPKIACINMHVAQYVAGEAPTSLSAKRHSVTLLATTVGVNIFNLSGKLLKTVPYSNIQSIDYE